MISSKKIVLFVSWLILFFAILFINFMIHIIPVPLKKSFSYFPAEIGDWKSRESINSDKAAAILMADDILNRVYENREGDKVELYFSYFEYTTEYKKPHSAFICWVGSGWTFKNLGNEKLALDCKKCPEVGIVKLFAQKDDTKILLFNCYKAGKRYTPNYIKFRALSALDSVLKRKDNAFTLQLSSQVTSDNLDKKEKLMKSFLVQVLSILETDYLP